MAFSGGASHKIQTFRKTVFLAEDAKRGKPEGRRTFEEPRFLEVSEKEQSRSR